MSSNRYADALKESQELSEMSDDALFEKLGVRLQDIHNPGGYERSLRYAGEFQQRAADLFGMADVKEFGRRWWKNLEPQLMKIVCDPANEDRDKLLGSKDIPQLAASLATSALISALAPPAWIIVVATILATKIAKAGLDTMCEMWGESLAKGNKP